jgi:hypothetical protein
MHDDPASAPNENPLIFVGTSVACFAMVLLMYTQGDLGVVGLIAMLLAAMNLGLLNLKYYNLLKRHGRLLSLIRLRGRLAAAQGTTEER